MVSQKRQARKHSGQNRLIQAIPLCQTLLNQAAERGYSLGTITASLLRLLDRYGTNEMEAAIVEALSKNTPHPNAVRLSLERRREERNQLPPIQIDLPDDARVRDLVVRPHDLTHYDQIQSLTEEKDDEK